MKKVVESKTRQLDVYSKTHKRTFCYIADAVEMIKLLTESDQTIGKSYNIGSDNEEITMGDLAQKIIDLVGKKIVIYPRPATSGSPERRCPDITRMRNVIMYEKKYPLEKGLKETFDWYKTNIFSGLEVSAL